MGMYVIKGHSTTYNPLVQGLNLEVRPLDPSFQFIGGQRTEEHVDLHHECAISKLQPGRHSTDQRAQFLQVCV